MTGRAAALLLALHSVACGGTRVVADLREAKVSYEDALAACGLDAPVGYLPHVDGQANVEISELCAETLGVAIGMDWASFGSAPRAFGVPEDSAEMLIAAAWLLMATDLGPVDGGCAMLEEGAEFCAKIEYFHRPGDGVNQALFEIVGAYTTVTRSAGKSEVWKAYYDDGVVTWSESIYLSPYGSTPDAVASTVVASTMVHEASHGFLPSHIEDCELTTSCDADGLGTYGVSAMLIGLRLENLPWTEGNQCSREFSDLTNACDFQILDSTDVPPCQFVSAWSC